MRSTAHGPLRIGIIGCGNVLSAYRAVIGQLRVRGWVEVKPTDPATLGLAGAQPLIRVERVRQTVRKSKTIKWARALS